MEFSYAGEVQIQLLQHVLPAMHSYTLRYLTSAVYGRAEKLRRPNGNIDGAAELHKYT